MRWRLNQSMQGFVDDVYFEPWIYRFVFIVLLVGLLASCIRAALLLHSHVGYALPYAGGPVGIVFFSIALLIFWLRPDRLSFVILIVYVGLCLRITGQLIYVLVAHVPTVGTQFLWSVGWMPVAYVLPFLIFRNRIAPLLSLLTFGLWVILSVMYGATHFGTVQSRVMLVGFSQIYAADIVLIVFMVLYARLRGLYMISRKSALRMEKMANTDFLLKIANRRALQVELNEELKRMSEGRLALSIVLIDIDHFKDINDKHGHATGDEVLIDITSVIASVAHPTCSFGRWGGEEFLLILPNVNGMEAYRIAEEMRRFIDIYQFRVGHITASFGIAECQVGDTSDAMLRRADRALYKSKQMGRNLVKLAE